MAETMEVGESGDVTLRIVREKDWLKSWMKAATGGSKERCPVGAEELRDMRSTMSAIQREFLQPVSPVAVPLQFPHTNESPTDSAADEVEALLTAPMEPTLSMVQTFALEECFLKAVTHDIMSQSSRLCLSYEAKARLWAMYLPAFRDQVSCILDEVESGGASAISSLETQLKSTGVIQACHDHLHLKYYLEHALKSLAATGVSSEVAAEAGASVRRLLQMQTRK